MKKDEKLPLVVIFGRTNVGKSTLFNALTEKHSALVSDTHGTTRDFNFGTVEWNRAKFELVDTGGIIEIENLFKKRKKKIKEINTLADLDVKVQELAQISLKKADVILFLVDTKDGLLPQDIDLAREVKKRKEILDKTILVANKADSLKLRSETAEFNKLALGRPLSISAATGSGTGDLLDLVVKRIKNIKNDEVSEQDISASDEEGDFDDDNFVSNDLNDEALATEEDEIINVCIIGKPNVGKSSLVNAIFGEEKIIVSPIAHTTREPNDTIIKYNDRIINLIDTAGISKQGQKGTRKSKTRKSLTSASINKSLNVLGKADIALLILDINDDLTQQDARIVEEIVNQNISLIIIGNKWDMVEERDTKEYKLKINRHLPFVTWAPIQFVSALTGEKVMKVLDTILEIDEKRKIRINPNYLTRFLQKLVKWHKPSKSKGTKLPYIYELRQLGVNPPRFQIRIGSKDNLAETYVRFIQNKLRDRFDFFGTPVSVSVTKNKRIHGMNEEDSWEVLEKAKEEMRRVRGTSGSDDDTLSLSEKEEEAIIYETKEKIRKERIAEKEKMSRKVKQRN